MRNTIKQVKQFLARNKIDILIITVLVVISGAVNGLNMFEYPYYENDEGTYLSQAWSVSNEGKLAPYTYWYDHAPAGWLFISIWATLTGGYDTFGFSINSGRVFMLVLHLLSTVMLYIIGKRLTNSRTTGIIAALVFMLTPLGTYFQRRILLDNIMVFWLLLSTLFLVSYKKRLSLIILSALAFAIAVLTKETAIVFLPALLYLLYLTAHKKHKKMALVQWSTVVGSVGFLYVLYALLKGELFPYGSRLGGDSEHVSLLGTLAYQSSRGSDTPILSSEGGTFIFNLMNWNTVDPWIMYIGVFSTVFCLIAGIRNIPARIIGLFALSYWFFLVRGGLVIDFYIIPLLPFIGLTTGCMIWLIYKYFSKYGKISKLIPILAIVAIVAINIHAISRNVFELYTYNQTSAQIDAVNWILSGKDDKNFIVIDNYGYIDLRTKNNDNFKTAEYYWKVDKDPDIREDLLDDDFRNIDYIVSTPQLEYDVKRAGLDLTGTALENAIPIKRFEADNYYVQIWQTKN